jgi:alpha-L-arabinofuranosidase
MNLDSTTLKRSPRHRMMRMHPLLALLVSLSLLAADALHAQTVNPTGYLTFDEGSGTAAADSSGNGNNATLLGKAGWTTGLVGPHALNLPAVVGSYAEVSSPLVDTTKSFSVAAWVKLTTINDFQTFVSEDGDSTSAFFLQLRADTHKFAFTIPYDFYLNTQSSFTPVARRWYHVAGVYDASAQSVSLYVDGILQDQLFNVVSSAAKGQTAIGRGQYKGKPVDFVNGAIDDVRFYSAALTGADILKIVQVGNPTASGPGSVEPATLQIDASHPRAQVSSHLYGLMIEEINHSLDGGLYSELIQNRVFKDDPGIPVHWSVVQSGGGVGSITLDTTQPIANTALTTSLKVSVTRGQRVGAANDGYWGIPVKPYTTYRASFYAKGNSTFAGPLTVDIENRDGSTVYARAQVPRITTDWTQYNLLLTTGWVSLAENARFVISASNPGVLWLNQVSVFPPTYKGRANGNRIDLMQKLAAIKPAFLRMPGGNYLEGNTINERFKWKNTLGPIRQRSGHQGPWGYRSDDGLGLLEYLEWCEDLHMEPLLAVYAGYSLNGIHVNPGTDLAPYVQDVLDEIQYVTGSANTHWDARRVADGHPTPFPLKYVEIGNEDFFDKSGSYNARFAQFYDAIKAVYPNLKLIATTGVSSRTPDVIDEHYYQTPLTLKRDVHHYDSYSRTGPKIFVGEYASIEGRPTPDLNAAIGDAAWLTGLERNSDIVIMSAYAPLLVNINSGASQWPTNLIGYDALHSYGSPSYYIQTMFSNHHGDVILPTTSTVTGSSQVFQSVTRDSQHGTIYLKVVNGAASPQPIHVTLKGVRDVLPTGKTVVLASASPQDTNTLTEPYKVIPAIGVAYDLGRSFDHTFAPYSITILEIKAK